MNTGLTPYRQQSLELKPTFNESGQSSFSARRNAPKAAKAAVKTRVLRHGHDRFRTPFHIRHRPDRGGKAPCRIPRLLARLLRQGVQPLPPGTALYARPGPGLARQAHARLGRVAETAPFRFCSPSTQAARLREA